jgi:SPOR domain
VGGEAREGRQKRLWVGLALTAAVGLVAGWGWRTPSVALIRLKLALDWHDRESVERALDTGALIDAALSQLIDQGSDEPSSIRLALHGDGGWLPAMTSARGYLRVRLGTALERLVERPESALRVSWDELAGSLETLERFGAVAFFVFQNEDGEYAVRMRQARGRWQIVSVEQDGQPVLLGLSSEPVPTAAVPEPGSVPEPEPGVVAEAEAAAVPTFPDPVADEPRGDPSERLAEAAALARANPLPRRPHAPRGRPFARRFEGTSWTVQVASTKDALEAELTREWFAQLGEDAFVSVAEVQGATWQRVLVGRYATLRDAERTVDRLEAQRVTTR